MLSHRVISIGLLWGKNRAIGGVLSCHVKGVVVVVVVSTVEKAMLDRLRFKTMLFIVFSYQYSDLE
jgi:hypothetical protein